MLAYSQRSSRRAFLSASAIAAVAAGCSQSRAPTSVVSQRNLKIFVYAGAHEATMREVFVPRFEQATGARLTLYAGWWDGMPKLKAAPESDPPFDLMITDATQGYPAAREGLFATLDLTRIPNHKSLVPASLDNWIFREGHGLPYPDSVMTLAYNRKSIIEPPRGWAELLRPDLAGKIGLYNHFYMSLFTFAAIMADREGQPGIAHHLIATRIDDVFAFARQERSKVGFWWSTTTEMILSLNDRTVSAGNMHSPEYLQAMRDTPNLAAVVPSHDRAMVQVFWAIPAGTKNKNLAEQAIDLLFSHEVQLEFARRGMATSRPDTAAAMALEDSLWKSLYPSTDEQFRSLRYYPYDVYATEWDELADRWDRTVLREG